MILALKTVNVLLLQKEKQDLEVLVKEMKDDCQKLMAESKEKSEEIAGCENMVSILTPPHEIMFFICFEYICT